MPASPVDPRARAALQRIERLGYWLDDRYRLPGTRFRLGLDGIVGLVPGVGDAVTSALTAYIVYEAWRLGAPGWTLARMLGNLAVDGLVGLVPVVGDLADIGFKANRRNLRLLHRHLTAHAAGRDTPAAARAAGSTRRAPRAAQVAETGAGSSSRTRRPPSGESSSETLPP